MKYSFVRMDSGYQYARCFAPVIKDGLDAGYFHHCGRCYKVKAYVNSVGTVCYRVFSSSKQNGKMCHHA